MHPARALIASLLLSAGLPASICHAQPASKPAAQPTSQPASPLHVFTAGELTRIALMDIRTVDEPTPDDFAITIALLNYAQTLSPRDSDIARRRCEAAWSAGDQETLLAATQRIVELDPKDTVATLRLLTSRISKLQTVEERLTTYDALLGPRGQSLDPSIRSRLSLDAALLLKERGDEAGFIARLKQATQLDSTNKDAALLAYSYFTQRSTDTLGRLELLSNLLMSDPLDPKVMEQLRDEFSAAGAYNAASRFNDICSSIYRFAGIPDSPAQTVRSMVLHWRNVGARSTLEKINEGLANQRAAAERQMAIATQDVAKFVARPEDIRLGADFEEVRLCAAIALNRAADAAASLADLTLTINGYISQLRDLSLRPKSMTDEQAQEEIDTQSTRLESWKLIVAVLCPPPAPAAPVAPPPPAPNPALSPLIEAWQAIQAADNTKAQAALDRADDSLMTRFTRAVAYERAAGNGEAARAYRATTDLGPLTALGVLASMREEALIAQSGAARSIPAVDPAAAEEFGKTIPKWIDVMAARPTSFQAFSAEPASPRALSLERGLINVRIRNIAPIPLAIGSGKTINTRLLFIPGLDGGGIATQHADPEVIEADRRLRLMPNEQLECSTWPEVGAVGFLIQQTSTFPVRVRWRVVQGFETGAKGITRPGLGCTEAQIDAGILHDALPEARLSPTEITQRLNTATDDSIPALLIASRLALVKQKEAGLEVLVDTLTARYPTWSSAARALAMCELPSSVRIPELKEFDEKLALEKDLNVLLIGCITRAKGPDDPLVVAILATNDPLLSSVVETMKDRLTRRAAAPPPEQPAPTPEPAPKAP